MPEKPPELNTFTVKEGKKEMIVVIPKTDDPVEDTYMEEAMREKTAEQLRNKPDKPTLTAKQQKERSQAMKEYNEWNKERKRRGSGKKYY